MNTRFLLASAAVAALSLAACSKPATSTDTTAANTSDATAAASAPAAGAPAAATTPNAAPLPTAAADFVNAAASTDMFEIAEAKIAEQKSTNADVKAFARMMVSDHTKSTAALKAAIAKSGQSLTPPGALPADKQAMVDTLNGAAAGDFDKTYIGQQVDAHTQALSVMQNYAQNGDTPALKDFAANTSKVVQMHLDKAEALQSSMK